MTVHCLEVVASDDVSAQNVRNKVSDLKSKYGEKLSKDAVPFGTTETEEGMSYYKGSFRVTLSDKASEKADLTDQIEKEADKSASWWRVKWHECDHDDGSLGGCSWGYENSNGNVPEEV